MKKKIIYLRVSKKELNEKTQLPIILKNFDLKENDCIILYEKISGYKEEVQDNRTELKKLLELVNNGVVDAIYVYSLERIYRNIDWLLKFYFDCRVNGVEVYSYLQPEINTFKGGKPIDTFLKYQSVLVNGFMAQQESYLISERTKKSFVIDKKGVKKSYKGNKLGRKNKLSEEIKEQIVLWATSGDLSYNEIIDFVKTKYKISISKATISNIINEK